MSVLAAAAFSTGAFAQAFTCSNPTITPNNSFTITCTPTTAPSGGGGGTTTSGGVFTLSGPATLTAGTTGTYTVTRNSAQVGAYSGTISVSTPSTCSVSAGGSFSVGDNSTAVTGNATVSASAAGTCTVNMALGSPTITIPTNAATISVATINVTVSAASGGGGGGSTPPAAGCPAVGTYSDLVDYPKASGPATTIRQASGVIGVFPMPNVNAGHNSGQMWITDNVVSASGSFALDVMISKCKGYIPTSAADITAAGACYYHSNIASYNEVDWWGAPSNPNNYPLSAMGFCPALQGGGQYYFNFKYTYQSCNYGTCGQVFTWYDGWLN